MKIKEALNKAAIILKEQDINEYQIDARFLLCHYLKKDLTYILLNGDCEIDPKLYFEMIEKRSKGVPVQYITGKAEFMSLEFNVSPHVLIPRQDTETVVEYCINKTNEGSKILDICTGSGCIAISLAKYIKCADVWACDISKEALKIAKENAILNNVNVNFYYEDILNPKSPIQELDLIVSNPPYIETDVIESLQTEVKNYEPRIALDGGYDGLVFYYQITDLAKKYLKKGGILAFEVGYNQGESVFEILNENNYKNTKIIQDYCGNDRVVIGIY